MPSPVSIYKWNGKAITGEDKDLGIGANITAPVKIIGAVAPIAKPPAKVTVDIMSDLHIGNINLNKV